MDFCSRVAVSRNQDELTIAQMREVRMNLSRIHAVGTNKPHAKDAKARELFSSQYESLNGQTYDRCKILFLSSFAALATFA